MLGSEITSSIVVSALMAGAFDEEVLIESLTTSPRIRACSIHSNSDEMTIYIIITRLYQIAIIYLQLIITVIGISRARVDHGGHTRTCMTRNHLLFISPNNL